MVIEKRFGITSEVQGKPGWEKLISLPNGSYLGKKFLLSHVDNEIKMSKENSYLGYYAQGPLPQNKFT